MEVHYNTETDLLYLRLDSRAQTVTNRRVSDELVLDIGRNGKLVGIEILDASKCLDISRILPVRYESAPTVLRPAMVRERTEYAAERPAKLARRGKTR